MKKLKIFFTAYIQVCLVALNTILLARGILMGVAVVGFAISLTWTFNVRNVAFSDTYDRLIYSFGASLGGVSGLLITKIFL
jgi:hypothetical protein